MFGIIANIYRLNTKATVCQIFNSSSIIKYCFKNISVDILCHTPEVQNFKYNSKFNNLEILNKSRKIHACGLNFMNFQKLSIQSNVLKNWKNISTNSLESNTKVTNNVMLYRFDKPWLFKLIIAFGIATVIGCFTMANNVYRILCKDLFNKDIDLKTRLENNALALTMIIIGILSGPIILFMFWFISKRSVKYLILHKGSEKVTIVTYHPLKSEINLTIPVDEISCIISRTDVKSYVSLKIKNRKFQYLLDKSGNFVNPKLFDTIIDRHRF